MRNAIMGKRYKFVLMRLTTATVMVDQRQRYFRFGAKGSM